MNEITPKPIASQKTWKSLKLSDETMVQLDEMRTWIEASYSAKLGGMKKPGKQVVLLHGPANSEKHHVAALLGKEMNMPVFAIRLLDVISKFAGETEKNLEHIFHKMEEKGAILLFDEADAIFGQRGKMKTSGTQFRTTEMEHLLQLIEDSPIFIMLSTNAKANINDPFVRRLRYIINFPKL